MMNSLIGSKNIEKDFEQLVSKYPEVIKCIPTLLAVRQYEIIDVVPAFPISRNPESGIYIITDKEK